MIKEFKYHLEYFEVVFEGQLELDKDYCCVLQALKLGQHSPTGTGAGVPSGHILISIVQKTSAQFKMATIENRYKLDRKLKNLYINIRLIGSIGVTLGLQALNDGQHLPTGIGAYVPSGQILRSLVQI